MTIFISLCLILLAVLWIDVLMFDSAVDFAKTPTPRWAFYPFGGFVYWYKTLRARTREIDLTKK